MEEAVHMDESSEEKEEEEDFSSSEEAHFSAGQSRAGLAIL